jgi:ribosomal protein L40E
VPEAWEYVVTVRPVVEDDASKPWTLSADLYAVDVALRHEAEGSFADTMSMRDLLDFLESDQGVSLTVREALALLRVGTRAANHPGALDRAQAWAPSRVAVERAAGNRTNEGVQNIHTALTVEVRALADDSLLTFTMPSQKVGALEAHPEGSARQKSVLRSKLLADATRAGARFGAATAAREAETLDAAQRCAEAARAAVAALEQHFGGAGSSSGRNADAHATTGLGPAAKKSLAGGTPPRAAPPANVRKLKRDAADAAARVEALVAAAARRAAAEEMGADEDPMFTGVLPAHEEHMRATTDHAYKPYGEAPRGEKREDVCGKADARNAADADKRRRVGGVGLRLKAHVDMDAGK